MSSSEADYDNIQSGSEIMSEPDYAPRVSDDDRYKFLLGQSKLFEYFIDAKKVGKSPLEVLKSSAKNTKHADDEGDRRHHHRKTEEEEDEELLEATQQEPSSFTFTESPAYVEGGKMRPYQIQGLNWLISLYDHGINGILADEMGLGKTLQTLSFLGYLRFLRNIPGPFLLVVPKSTLQNWLNEVRRWIPKFNAFILHGNKEQRAAIIKERLQPRDFEICITSYEMCLMEKAAMRKVSWYYLVIDEAHRIKNENSMLSQIVRGFDSRHRLLITGTPLQNNLHELWALLNYLLPDVFSSAEDFDQWFLQHGEQQQDQDQMVHQLRALLQPFLLRRLKADVEHSLLPKKEINLYVGMTEMQRLWYRKILEKDIEAVNGLTKGREGTTRLLNIVMQLRKCSNHPYLFDGAEPGPPFTTDEHIVENAGKMAVLDKLLARLKAGGSRVLLFSQMSRMLDILEDYCVFRGYEYCRIDGQTPHEERIEAIDEYNRPGSKKFIFLLTTRAGGLGINLATADVVILYDSDWNPQVDLQAQDRAHRIGQTKQVFVFRLLTEASVEEKVIERAMQKLRLDQLVIQQGKLVNANKTLGREEMLAMIRYGAEMVLSSKKAADKNAADLQDIEAILAKGEERTKELQERYRNAGFEDLLSANAGAAGGSLYEWEGEDFASSSGGGALSGGHKWIELSKRERKPTYSVDYYYREALRVHPKKDRPIKAPVPRACIIHDHQLFPAELRPLLEKEIRHHQRTLAYKLTEVDYEDAKERSAQQKLIDTAQPLTAKEQRTRDDLYAQGFPEWSKKDYLAFIRGCERYGRADLESIAGDMEKEGEEVRRYAKAFWQRLDTLPDGDKIRGAVERGEQRLARAEQTQNMLADFIHANPASQPIHLLQHASAKSRNYTPDEDELILRKVAEHGYGNDAAFPDIQHAARTDPVFRFDWFLRTRTTAELAQRAAKLVALVEREVKARAKEREAAAAKKRKSPSTTTVRSAKRPSRK